jgi:hypothetical protein
MMHLMPTHKSSQSSGFIPIAMAILFALLWAIWIQPHTISLRHILLSLGSLLGIYVVINNRRLLVTKEAIPLYLIGALFVWIAFHLAFLSQNFTLQLEEFATIWKRIAWGTPFAIGLGLALGFLLTSLQSEDKGRAYQLRNMAWWILFLGVLTPTMIYLCRYLVMAIASKLGFQLPQALMILHPPSSWYIPKTGYVFFCIPALALSCASISSILRSNAKMNLWKIGIYVLSIIAVVAVFYLENIKNGIAYSVVLVLVLILQLLIHYARARSIKGLLAIVFVAGAFSLILAQHLHKNDSWNTVLADIKVANQLETIDHWKYRGDRGYPNNEFGKMVSVTNYERAAWAQVALEFIAERPQGYGLVLESFRHIGKEKWPESNLLQSHSGWLDLTLGIGIPGVALIILAAFLSIRSLSQCSGSLWSRPVIWLLSSIGLLMITTEVSQKVYLDALIFLILFSASLSLGSSQSNKAQNY